MLDRLQRHAQQLDGYTAPRWHVNHATHLTMRKGALLQNSQSREGGVSARCYREGAFGFASRPGDSDAAIVAALAQSRANGTLYECVVGSSAAILPRTEPRTGVYDYHSRRDPLNAGERTDLLCRLNDAVALTGLGHRLRAGEVVRSETMAKMVPAEKGNHFTVDFGAVTLGFSHEH
jgi:TldD protein